MDRDTIFEMGTSKLRFGSGATSEVGMDLKDMGARRVLLLTDERMAALTPVAKARASLEREGLAFDIYDKVRVEPTDASFKDAAQAASGGQYDAFVAVGGGSTIDTAKAANLYSTHPDDFFAYVNAPIGQAKPVPGPLKPLIAIPTTAGTGSEATGVAIFDWIEGNLKTGISHPLLKPNLGILDPDNTATMPPLLAAATGLDVICHALESFTAIPYDSRPRPERPKLRPPFQGSNPISDIWACEAVRLVANFLPRAWAHPGDDEARAWMLMASSYAGMGFSNAGVHLCHAMSYAISSLAKSWQPPDYPTDHPYVPHGVCVILTAPAVFRFTAPTTPWRHLLAAELFGADVTNTPESEAGAVLSRRLVEFIRQFNIPNGLAALGLSRKDIPALVEKTLPQQRLTKLAPRSIDSAALAAMFEEAMTLW